MDQTNTNYDDRFKQLVGGGSSPKAPVSDPMKAAAGSPEPSGNYEDRFAALSGTGNKSITPKSPSLVDNFFQDIGWAGQRIGSLGNLPPVKVAEETTGKVLDILSRTDRAVGTAFKNADDTAIKEGVKYRAGKETAGEGFGKIGVNAAEGFWQGLSGKSKSTIYDYYDKSFEQNHVTPYVARPMAFIAENVLDPLSYINVGKIAKVSGISAQFPKVANSISTMNKLFLDADKTSPLWMRIGAVGAKPANAIATALSDVHAHVFDETKGIIKDANMKAGVVDTVHASEAQYRARMKDHADLLKSAFEGISHSDVSEIRKVWENPEAVTDPALAEKALGIRKVFDQLVTLPEKDMGILKNELDNYLPHIMTKEAQQVMGEKGGKPMSYLLDSYNPFEGSGAATKHRDIMKFVRNSDGKEFINKAENLGLENVDGDHFIRKVPGETNVGFGKEDVATAQRTPAGIEHYTAKPASIDEVNSALDKTTGGKAFFETDLKKILGSRLGASVITQQKTNVLTELAKKFGRFVEEGKDVPEGMVMTPYEQMKGYAVPKEIATYLTQYTKHMEASPIATVANYVNNMAVQTWFTSPTFLTYHILHNLGFNTFLAKGPAAFFGIPQAAADVAAASSHPIISAVGQIFGDAKRYQEARYAGAIRPEHMGDVGEYLAEGAGGMQKLLKTVSPWSDGFFLNKAFERGEAVMRQNLFNISRNQGSTVEEAAKYTNHFMGNYQNMTDFERTWMRTIFPFYSWMKTNLTVQNEALFSQTGKYMMPVKARNAIQEMMTGQTIWDNKAGYSFRLRTGKKDAAGNDVYIDPGTPDKDVYEIYNSPAKYVLDRMGIVPNIASLVMMNRTISEIERNVKAKSSITPVDILSAVGTQFLPSDARSTLAPAATEIAQKMFGDISKFSPKFGEETMDFVTGTKHITTSTVGKTRATDLTNLRQEASYTRKHDQQSGQDFFKYILGKTGLTSEN